jgi:hypothetical protein
MQLEIICRQVLLLKVQVKFSGHVVSEEQDKINNVRDWLAPNNADLFRSFILFAGSYRGFLNGFPS